MSARLRLLITGASGWIGSAVAQAARADDQRLEPFLTDVVPGASSLPFLAGDLCDPGFAVQLLEWSQPDAILHLAGTNHNAPYDRHWSINIGATVALLEAATARGWQGHFLNLGSAAEYGVAPGESRYAETLACHPRGAYGVSKHLQHQAVRLLGERAGWWATHLRLFNPIGPGMRPHLMLGRLISQLAAAPRERDPVPVELWTGHPRRDYLAVTDAAALLVRAARERWEVDLVNLGSGQPTSVREVIALMERVIGRRIEATYTRPEMGVDDTIVADTTRLAALLDPTFRFTDLEVILRQAWSAAQSGPGDGRTEGPC